MTETVMKRLQWAALASGIFCLFFIQHTFTGDGLARFQALQKLLLTHDFSGLKYSWVGPLFAFPLGLAGGAIYFNFIVFIAGIFYLGRLLRPILEPSELRIFLILLVFGSLFPYSTKNFYGETFSAITLAVGSVVLSRDREGWAAPWLALAAANSPALFLPLALLLGFRCYDRKSLRPLWILGPAILILLVDRWIRFHDLFHSGYETDAGYPTFLPFSGLPGFSYPFLLGLTSILFSFGKGILFFFPGLWVSNVDTDLSGARRTLGRYWIVLVVGLVLIYTKWWAWYGGWYWGPRFFLFCSFPASYFLAIFLESLRKASAPSGKISLALLLLAAAFWVCISGLLYDQSGLDVCYRNNYALESACWYIPEFSPIFRPLVIHEQPVESLAILIPVWIFGFLVLALPILKSVRRSKLRQ